MIKTWPGQTKEEWLAEYYRNQNLTSEEKEEELNEFMSELNKSDENKEQELAVTVRQPSEDVFADCDHPNSLDNDEATIAWVVVMATATIFNGGWIIWIIATIIWRKYITRHKRKK